MKQFQWKPLLMLPTNPNPRNLWTVSPSQMEVWEDCPEKWHLYYQEELSRKRASARHFDFGNYTHELMHVYYQLLKLGHHKPGSDFLINAMQSRVRQDLTGENILLLADVWPRLLSYFRNQSSKIDAGMQVLEVEYEVHVPVTTPKGREIMLHGILDLLYRDSAGVIRIRDHKTFGNPKSHTPDNIKLNPQLLFYAVALSSLFPSDVLDVEVNAINSTIYKSKQPTQDEMFKLVRWRHTPVGISIARENILRKIDLMFDTAPWLNYRTSCTSCQFFDICNLKSRGMNTTSLVLQTYEKGKRSARIKSRGAQDSNSKDSSADKEFTISFTNI